MAQKQCRAISGKTGTNGPLPVRMDLSLFCEMSFIFLDRVFTVTFGGERKLKLLERMLGHLRKGKAGCLFRKAELKIEPCY